MFGILVSALNAALAFLVKSIIAKFFVFFALYFVVSEFVSYLSSRLPDFSELSGAFSSSAAAPALPRGDSSTK